IRLDRVADDPNYLRPMLRRDGWALLDGEWEFADDPRGRWRTPREVRWTSRIVVPFAPETEASGIGSTGYRLACWYRLVLELPVLARGEHLVLRFGAIDYAATVWLDSYPISTHEGGYCGFAVDLTSFAGTGPHELVVRAEDDPHDLAKPRGKQDWEPEPHAIWYQRTTGIWQSVWLERVPPVSVRSLHWSANLDSYEIQLDARFDGPLTEDMRLRVRLAHGDRELVDDLTGIIGPKLERGYFPDFRGLDTLRDELTWSPDHPAIIDALVEIIDPDGEVMDTVSSYTAMRTVGIRQGLFVLNGRPFTLRLVLDQGYWPQSGLTAPNAEALRYDVELVKAMGFNGVRKHQKIEDPRFLAWADRLGLLVWEEMPSCYHFDEVAVQRLAAQWAEVVERDRSHPCIVAWVPFNESTGVMSLPLRAQQRHYVEGISLLTRALDPSRLIVSNDGWEGIGGDIIGLHDYDDDGDRLRGRYAPTEVEKTLAGFGNSGRQQLLDDPVRPVLSFGSSGPRAIVLTEFGGIGFTGTGAVIEQQRPTTETPEDRLHHPASWGYSTVASPVDLVRGYADLVAAVLSLDRLSGFCYTQLTDTYQEVNGLLRGDRTPKASLEEIARATLGPFPSRHGVPQQRVAPPLSSSIE
ncbi:MAG: glycoside hydrolase family 2, partial [Actinobacteria bacterium]|nr:glycoside hydrolase family 2 [Actinomycetota bacterium]